MVKTQPAANANVAMQAKETLAAQTMEPTDEDTRQQVEEDTPDLPPLFIRCDEAEWTGVYDRITACCQSKVDIEPSELGTTIKLTATSAEDLKALNDAMAALVVKAPPKKTPPTRREKIAKVLLRGLPWLVSEGAVKEGLQRAGFKAHAAKLHNRTNRKRPPLFTAAVEDGSGAIFGLKRLLGLPVIVEALPPSMDMKPQCFKCQEEGHVAKHCRNAPKCVKCSGAHDSRACSRQREEAATCARCGGPHVASWRGCPAFSSSQPQEMKRRRRRGRRRRPPPRERAPNGAENPAPGARGGSERPTSDRGGKTEPTAAKERRPREDNTEMAARSCARPADPASSDRGGGGGRTRGAKQRRPPPNTRATAEGGLPGGDEEEGRNQNIDAVIAEAEARFRTVLHAEMEAACLLLREAHHQRLHQEAEGTAVPEGGKTTAVEERGTQTHVAQQEGETQTEEVVQLHKKKKWVMVSRAVQTTGREETTKEARDAESQTKGYMNWHNMLMVPEEYTPSRRRQSEAEDADPSFFTSWLEFRHTQECRNHEEEERRDREREERRHMESQRESEEKEDRRRHGSDRNERQHRRQNYGGRR